MNLTVKDSKGGAVGEIPVPFQLIENGKGTQAVHDAVVAHNRNQRMGTACTKTMGEVAGSGKKPWRQKGTGRARAGSFASPLWRGGGVTFGPKPRDFSLHLGRNTRRLALRKALSERLKGGDVTVVSELSLAAVKTRDLLGMLSALQVEGTTLLVTETADRNIHLSARNIPSVHVTTGDELNTYEVLKADKLVFTRAAFEKIGKRLSTDKA